MIDRDREIERDEDDEDEMNGSVLLQTVFIVFLTLR